MTRLLAYIHAATSRCAVLPLVLAGLFLVCARVGAVVPAPQPRGQALVEPTHPDQALIDAVLAKRGPGLGLTLRQQLAVAIDEEARKAGYDPLLILAIIDVESEFDGDAVSDKGARGLMQIRPSTLQFLAERQGLRLSREEVDADPALCVRLGVRYLKALQDHFGGDLDMALMAYNAGPAKIRVAQRRNDLDFFRFYPRRVRHAFRQFREGAGLGGDWALAQRDRE